MITDSIAVNIPDKEFADALFSSVDTLITNTDTWYGISKFITILSIVASVATIVGLTTIIIEFAKRKVSKDCQMKIMLDLIRHFFMNNAISEVIRIKMSKRGEGFALKEGIMQRYGVLDSDIELGQISHTSKDYELLHDLRLNLRNYNISVSIAEKHFTNPKCPQIIKIEDLNDIMDRAQKITNLFIEFAEKRKMKMNKDLVGNYIRHHYEKESKIPKWKKEGKLDYPKTLPVREPGTARAFYNDLFDLKDIEDSLIRYKFSYIVCID